MNKIRCTEQCTAKWTHPEFGFHPCRLTVKDRLGRVIIIWGKVVVRPRPSRLIPVLTHLDQAWKVLPAQQAQDAVHVSVVTNTLDFCPTPATSQKDEILVCISISKRSNEKILTMHKSTYLLPEGLISGR